MEHENESGSSEHLNMQPDVTSNVIDEDPLNHDEMVGYASSSSISSSSSLSYSYQLEVDGGEFDMTFPEFEENGSISPRSNHESPSTTPKLRMISVPPQAGGEMLTTGSFLSPKVLPQVSDLSALNDSPKQCPPIQVMRQPAGYDSNRSPLSIFASEQINDSDWSPASNESLFSIQMGSDSFSMDSGFFISLPEELDWLDDGLNYSCFTPDANKSSMSPYLPTVMDSAAENEQKSAGTDGDSVEKEEILETQSASPIDSEKEMESSTAWEAQQSFSIDPNVPQRIGASPTEGLRNSASTARLSCASGQSTGSFAFPVLAGGSPTNVDAEKSPPTPPTPQTPKGAAEAETTPEAPSTTPKAGGYQWFHCFSCFPICC